MRELVTAIITTYKREPDIVERALKSILMQTYDNLEIFVVDDSPVDYVFRDEVAAMVNQYRDRGVFYIPHERNMGACAARNTGLEVAKGTYIGYLDDDDEWMPEKIERQVAVFENNDASLGMVYNCYMVLDENTGETRLQKRKGYRGNILPELLNEGNIIGGTSIPLMRTSVLRGIGGFDPSLEAAQDYDVWVRIAENNTIEFIDDYLNRYYVHKGEQITSNPHKRLSARLRIAQKYAHYLAENDRMCWRLNLDIAWIYADLGQKKKALQLWGRYVWKQPLRIKENLRFLYLILR